MSVDLELYKTINTEHVNLQVPNKSDYQNSKTITMCVGYQFWALLVVNAEFQEFGSFGKK